MVKTLHFQCREYGFYLLSLVRELISHMPCSLAKRKKKKDGLWIRRYKAHLRVEHHTGKGEIK